MSHNFTPETLNVLSRMTYRFFLIQPDGSIRRLNEHGVAIEWVFKQARAALRHAARSPGVRVWDNFGNRFI